LAARGRLGRWARGVGTCTSARSASCRVRRAIRIRPDAGGHRGAERDVILLEALLALTCRHCDVCRVRTVVVASRGWRRTRVVNVTAMSFASHAASSSAANGCAVKSCMFRIRPGTLWSGAGRVIATRLALTQPANRRQRLGGLGMGRIIVGQMAIELLRVVVVTARFRVLPGRKNFSRRKVLCALRHRECPGPAMDWSEVRPNFSLSQPFPRAFGGKAAIAVPDLTTS